MPQKEINPNATYEMVDEVPIQVMSSHQLAELLGVTDGSLRNMRMEGRLPDHIKLGGRRSPVLYLVEDVQAWLKQMRDEQNRYRHTKAVK